MAHSDASQRSCFASVSIALGRKIIVNADKQKNTGTSLIRTVTGSELGDVVFDAAEVALDSVLSEGVLKELPVVGAIAKIIRAGGKISEELFIRKLLRFLQELKDVPIDERQQLLKNYPSGSPEQQELGENILLAIEKLDDVCKPEILGRFFIAFVNEEVDYLTFRRLTMSLERFNLSLLPYLKWFYLREGEQLDLTEDIEHELSLAGLVTVSLAKSGTFGGSANYVGNNLGRQFIKYGYNFNPKE